MIRVLGKEHPDTLTAMSNLALTLSAQGDHAEARGLEEQVLVVAKMTCHLRCADHISLRGRTYFFRGQLLLPPRRSLQKSCDGCASCSWEPS